MRSSPQWIKGGDKRFTIRGLPWFSENDGDFSDGGQTSDHGFQLIVERLAPVIERILMRTT